MKSLEENATLSHFNHKDPIMLKTDASKQGVAGILLQRQQGEWKMVTCCSRRLSECEENYRITDIEGLAVIYCVQKLRNYLLGKHFEIIVDHCALCVLNKRMPNSPRLKRWAIILAEFDFEIKYTKGGLHQDVDCLSRAPIDDGTDSFLDSKVYHIIIPNEPSEWINSYTSEESDCVIHDAINKKNNYKLIDHLIYYGNNLYVPESKREILLKEAHSTPSGGHGGRKVTLEKLKGYYWQQMDKDVNEFVDSCQSCQARKVQHQQKTGDIYHHVTIEPLDVVAID